MINNIGNIAGGTEEPEIATIDNYTLTTPANWAYTAPATVQSALDRLAAAVSSSSSNPIP